jgi:HPt (histidine-containing phosphotransfer) domain-containing protein
MYFKLPIGKSGGRVAKLIDNVRLMNEFAGDEEILAELSDSFIAELPKMMAAIQDSISSNDSKSLEISAHTLKGVVANFQAPAVKQAAFLLETQGREKNFEGVDENFKKLKVIIDEMIVELWSVLKRAG